MVEASIFGKTAGNTMVNGKTMIWRELAFIFGQMVEDMKGNIITIKKMDLEHIIGLMEENTRVGGIKVNSMD